MVQDLADLVINAPLLLAAGAGIFYLGRDRLAKALFRLKNRNKTRLEILLGNADVNRIKKELAKEYDVDWKQITFEEGAQNKEISSTTAKGGYLTRVAVMYEDKELTAFYHKANPFRTELGKWSPEDIATFVQSYLIKQDLHFIPKPISTSGLVGNLSEEIKGETLEARLSRGMSIYDRETIFRGIVGGIVAINLRSTESFKQKLRMLRYDTGDAAEATYKEFGQVLGDRYADILSRELDLFGGNSLCHGDLRPKNIVFSPDKAYFIDWSNTRVGDIYFELYQLQAMFDIHDDSIIDSALKQLHLSHSDRDKQTSKAKGHLMQATKVKRYMAFAHEKELHDGLEHLWKYHLYSALADLDDGRELRRFTGAQDVYFDPHEYARLQMLYHNTTRMQSELLERCYEHAVVDQGYAINKHQNDAMELRVASFRNSCTSWVIAGYVTANMAILGSFHPEILTMPFDLAFALPDKFRDVIGDGLTFENWKLLSGIGVLPVIDTMIYDSLKVKPKIDYINKALNDSNNS